MKYRKALKEFILSSDIKRLFIILVNHGNIEEIKKFPDFDTIRELAIAQLSSQEIFDDIALDAVRTNKLHTLKFLIENCKFGITSVECQKKNTLLHEACYYNATAAIVKLLKNNYALNAVNSSGLTPFHIALLSKNEKVAAILKTPVNEKMKIMDQTYEQLKTGIKNGTTGIKVVKPISQSNEYAEQTKIRATYYFEVFNAKFNHKLFQNIITSLTKKSGILNADETHLLIDAYILFNSSNNADVADVIANLLFAQVKNKKIKLGDVLIRFIQICNYFINKNQNDIIEFLCDIASQLLNTTNQPDEKTAPSYSAISVFYQKIGQFKKAEQAATSGLDATVTYGKNTNEDKAELFFNLAINQDSQFKTSAALENYANAFALIKTDKDITKDYIAILVRHRDHDKALEICQLSDCGEYSKIFTTVMNVICGKLSWNEGLEKISCNFADYHTKILALWFNLAFYLRLGEYTKAIETQKMAFALCEKEYQNNLHLVDNQLIHTLKTYIECKKYDEALIFLKTNEKKYNPIFRYNIRLKGFSAILYSATQQAGKAESLINEILKSDVQLIELSNSYLLLGIDALQECKNNYTHTIHYFDFALKIDPNNIKAKLYQLLVCILDQDKKKLFSLSKEFDLDFLIDLGSRMELWELSPQENTEVIKEVQDPLETETEFHIECDDPTKIHQFFQSQKKQIQNDLNDWLFCIKDRKTQWTIKNHIYLEATDKMVILDSDFYPNYYAIIDPNLKLDEKVLERFQIALQKGVCKKSLAQNGIKILKNSVIELKIDADIRLYATVIYKNQDNKYLIVFDKIGNHESIERLLRAKKPLEMIEVYKPQKEASHLNNYQGSHFANPAMKNNNNNNNNSSYEESSTFSPK